MKTNLTEKLLKTPSMVTLKAGPMPGRGLELFYFKGRKVMAEKWMIHGVDQFDKPREQWGGETRYKVRCGDKIFGGSESEKNLRNRGLITKG